LDLDEEEVSTMEFELLPVLIAGFVGTVAMTAGMAMGASSSASFTVWLSVSWRCP